MLGILISATYNNGGHIRIRTRDKVSTCRIALVNRLEGICYGWFIVGCPTQRPIFEQDYFRITHDYGNWLQSQSLFAIGFHSRYEIPKIIVSKNTGDKVITGEITYLMFRRHVFVDHHIRLHRQIVPSDENVRIAYERLRENPPKWWNSDVVRRYDKAFEDMDTNEKDNGHE